MFVRQMNFVIQPFNIITCTSMQIQLCIYIAKLKLLQFYFIREKKEKEARNAWHFKELLWKIIYKNIIHITLDSTI